MDRFRIVLGWFPSMALALVLACLFVSSAACSTQTAQPDVTSRAAATHPLDPLSAAEIERATSVLRDAGRLEASVRFVILESEEPAKASVAEQLSTGRVRRIARAVLYDWRDGETTDIRIDLQSPAIVSTTTLGQGEPPVRHAIVSRATEVALADDRVVQALQRRGVTDLGRVTFLGGLGEGGVPERRGSARLIDVSPFLWDELGELAIVPDLSVRIDLAAGVVEQIRDAPGPPSARPSSPVDREGASLKPLRVTQTDGPSFQIRGSEITWDRWRLHVALHPRRGIDVFDVSFRDDGEYRPVLYRGNLSELITPYGDPSFGSWYPRDEGDYGLASYSGARAQAIIGADAPDNASFVGGSIADPKGQVVGIERAIAIYERDAGVLWRHASLGRRARQLVLSAFTTVDNYDYLFHWIFSQDGAIDVQVQLTGVVNFRPVSARTDTSHSAMTSSHYGHLVAPGINAPHHQHFFSWRLDLDLDGAANRVVELNTRNAQTAPGDSAGEWFAMERATLRSELEAQRDVDMSTARRWLVVNNNRMNALQQPSAYVLLPGENAPPFQSPTSAPRRHAAFLNHHLWVTRYDPLHMYASGEWVNHRGVNEGVAMWSLDDEGIVDEDVVLWHTVAVTHLPRPEDWPVMPAHTAGFRLVPVGFFASNPTLTR